jgi:Resolvase, N terminal domain
MVMPGYRQTNRARRHKAAGCEKVFQEIASGTKTDRNQLRHALEHLAAGDVLMVMGYSPGRTRTYSCHVRGPCPNRSRRNRTT